VIGVGEIPLGCGKGFGFGFAWAECGKNVDIAKEVEH
jgi:hypothetical protein